MVNLISDPNIVQLLKRKQVAKQLGVCTESVKRYTRDGRLAAIRINSRVVRYEPEAVAKFIANARTGTNPDARP